MIAGRHGHVAGGIHELDGILAHAQVDQRRALGGIARVQQQHIVSLCLQVLFILRDGRVAEDARLGIGHRAAVHVVGMQNIELAFRGFFRSRGKRDACQHHQGKQQGQKSSLLHEGYRLSVHIRYRSIAFCLFIIPCFHVYSHPDPSVVLNQRKTDGRRAVLFSFRPFRHYRQGSPLAMTRSTCSGAGQTSTADRPVRQTAAPAAERAYTTPLPPSPAGRAAGNTAPGPAAPRK